MAIEGIGLVAGILPLFNTAIDTFRLFRVAKAYGDDYNLYEIRLAAASLRLSRWGESLGLQSVQNQDQLQLSRYEAQGAENELRKLCQELEKAIKDGGLAKQIKATESATDQLPGVCQKIQALTLTRKNKSVKSTQLVDKMKWALYRRDEADRWLANVERMVDNLVDLFSDDKNKAKQNALCSSEAEELGGVDTQERESLMKILADRDEGLVEELRKCTPSAGSTYNTANLTAHENSGAMIGNTAGNLHYNAANGSS